MSDVPTPEAIEAERKRLAGLRATIGSLNRFQTYVVAALGLLIMMNVWLIANVDTNEEPSPPTTTTTVVSSTTTEVGQTTTSTPGTTPTTPTTTGTASAGICTSRTANGGVPVDKFPGAACTGPVETALLTSVGANVGGFYWIDQDGAVVQNLRIDAEVCIAADNVTLRNVFVDGHIISVANPIGAGACATPSGAHNATFIDVEVRAMSSGTTAIEGGVYSAGISCVRCDLHRAGAAINGGHYTLTDTYVHDLYASGPEAHVDGIQVGGAGGYVQVVHSNIEGTFAPESLHVGMSCAVCLYTHGPESGWNWGEMNDVLIQSTRIQSADAVYCAYGGDSAERDPSNIRYINNTFIREPSTGTCGSGGPITGWYSGGGNVFSGNHFDDGEPINA